LRIDFPEVEKDPELEAISWEDFFDKFDCAHLAFLYQEETKEGQKSYFCKFLNRGSEGGHAKAA
jgi:hypothetical protein